MISVDVIDRKGKKATFLVEEGQRILHAGLLSGIGLPHECATGTCGNCKASLVSGSVSHYWPEAPGAKVCRKAGEILLCQTSAVSALELTLPSAFIDPCQPPSKHIRGRLSGKQLLTAEVGLFEVTLSEPMNYKAGQFVLLSGLGIEGPRAYSMTHHEPAERRLRFLIRRSSGGAFTAKLFEEGALNQEIAIFGPLGRATFDRDEDRPIVAVAGGSGIAGIMSIVRQAIAESHFYKHPSHLFFGLRDADSSYLLNDLVALAERSEARLRVTVVFSDAPCSMPFAAKYPLLDFRFGLVHEIMRDSLAFNEMRELRSMEHPLFFVGGPPLMVNATMRSLISDLKISPTEIRYDRFG